MKQANKQIHIIGGGTVFHIRNHLALCAPAYGSTAASLSIMFCHRVKEKMDVHIHMTKMAYGNLDRTLGAKHVVGLVKNTYSDMGLETNEDISNLVDKIIANPMTKVVVMSAALCDFEGYVAHNMIPTESGKHADRLHSNVNPHVLLTLLAGDKIVSKIRKDRKDIFLVAFKTTCGATEQEQYAAGLGLCKGASCNLVLANDTKTRLNMVVTPEEAKYHVTTDRTVALKGLVEMTLLRSHLTFTRSTVVAGDPVPWDSPEIPTSLRAVVDYCIKGKAYKPFRGATVGHFAARLAENEFLTSMRKTDFNDLGKIGLVRIKTDGPDTVIAYGAKPSVGGQSQRIVFQEHAGYDCIVHFHCPLKKSPRDKIPVVSQREVECGSHQCGKNTSQGLKQFGPVRAVMLDQHGPNIVFNRDTPPEQIIEFIEANFDLDQKTGGYVSE